MCETNGVMPCRNNIQSQQRQYEKCRQHIVKVNPDNDEAKSLIAFMHEIALS